MLYSDCIEKLLQLEDVIVTNIECIDDEMHIELRMEKRFHHCPRCNTLTSKVHDYRTQLVKDVSIAGYNTILHLHKRRHVCPSCGKRFDEEIEFLPKYHRFTNRVFMQIYKQFKECRSIKGIAKDNNMSPPTAAKVIDLIDHTAFELPEVLAIDEFRGNAEGEKFQCILTDPKNHRIIEILPTRKHEDIYDYLSHFNSLENVKYVVMDMTGGYKALMKRLFPDATIIVDKYHYVRQIGYALERTRIEEQKRLSDKWRKYFKRSKYLLLKNPKDLNMDDYTQLQNLFRISPKLKEAYDIKLEFEDVIASKNRKDAAWRLSKWIVNVQNSELEEFKKVAETYFRWRTEILNSFAHPYTNGFTEGCNNRIKVLKRVSFGMPRFKRFRRRILHIMLD